MYHIVQIRYYSYIKYRVCPRGLMLIGVPNLLPLQHPSRLKTQNLARLFSDFELARRRLNQTSKCPQGQQRLW